MSSWMSEMQEKKKYNEKILFVLPCTIFAGYDLE